MLTRLNTILTTETIISSLNEMIAPAARKSQVSLEKQLAHLKTKLSNNFFEGKNENEIINQLQQDVRFNNFPKLKETIETVFLLKDDVSIDDLQTLNNSPLRDIEVDPLKFEELDNEYGYFTGCNNKEALNDLFVQLTKSLFIISVFIEQNGTTNIAYDYAYKLMALLVDNKANQVNFASISKDAHTLLTLNQDKKTTQPFYDLLFAFKLPKACDVKDKANWDAFIKANGKKALFFYENAKKIESKNNFKAPSSMQDALHLDVLCRYERASEDLELAKLCQQYEKPDESLENLFNLSLDFMHDPKNAWPKTSDNLPNVQITDGSKKYFWVKLPSHDKRAFMLGKIVDCCQSIDGAVKVRQCVKNALTLSDNGLYVLLKRPQYFFPEANVSLKMKQGF